MPKRRVLHLVHPQILHVTVGHLRAEFRTSATEVAEAASEVQYDRVLADGYAAAPQPADGVQRLQFKKGVCIFLVIKMQADELVDNHAATLAQHLRLRRPSQLRVARNIGLSLRGGFGWVVAAMGTSNHLYSGFAGKMQWFIKRFGWRELFLLPLRKIISPVVLPFLTPRHFKYCDGLLPCHYANYNVTWSNERCVEVSLGRWYLEQIDGPVLEIGNVLGYYDMNSHTVVDKFETGEGVINEDITKWQTDQRFALILSLSTFEHIGFDDDNEDQSAGKILSAIAACRALLQPAGRLVITVPLGYNPHLDQLIEKDDLGQDRASFLLRSSAREWSEVARHQAVGTPFGRPWPYANALMVAEFAASS